MTTGGGSRVGPWMASHGGSLILVVLGSGLLMASVAQGDGNEAYAFGLLIFGSGLVTLGVVLPRLRNAELGPATGFKLTLADDVQRELSTGLAASDDGAPVQVSEVVAATRVVLSSEVLGRLLAPDDGPLAGAWFHLYLFDDQRELLLPAFEGRPSPSQGWKPGVGAVGEAWASGEYVLVRGPEVSDHTYGLTLAQQHRARNLAVGGRHAGHQRARRRDRRPCRIFNPARQPAGHRRGIRRPAVDCAGSGTCACRPAAVVFRLIRSVCRKARRDHNEWCSQLLRPPGRAGLG